MMEDNRGEQGDNISTGTNNNEETSHNLFNDAYSASSRGGSGGGRRHHHDVIVEGPHRVEPFVIVNANPGEVRPGTKVRP